MIFNYFWLFYCINDMSMSKCDNTSLPISFACELLFSALGQIISVILVNENENDYLFVHENKN